MAPRRSRATSPTSMPPSSPASSTPAALSWARCTASTSASRAAATRARPGRCRIHGSRATRPAARPPAARRASRRAGGGVRWGGAIGRAQGGPIPLPSAYCGVYGLKPTYGLVPYTGVFPIELTLDHVGPMTSTVADNALLLEVLAGPDGLDPRQIDVRMAAYTTALTRDARGLRIAVVREGFGHSNSETDVDALVRKGAATFRQLGAQVDEGSIPLHLSGPAIWTPIAAGG